jgi:hypothetical protein
MNVPDGIIQRLLTQSTDAVALCSALGATLAPKSHTATSVYQLRKQLAQLNKEIQKIQYFDPKFNEHSFRSAFGARVRSELKEKKLADLGNVFNFAYLTSSVTSPYVREAMCKELINIAQEQGQGAYSLWTALVESEGVITPEIAAQYLSTIATDDAIDNHDL